MPRTSKNLLRSPRTRFARGSSCPPGDSFKRAEKFQFSTVSSSTLGWALLGGSSHDLQVVRITPSCKPQKGHFEREQPYLGDLLTMVINHLLTGMILQVYDQG